MIEQQARVVQSADTLVRVRIGGQSGCPVCDAGKGCGAGLFGKLLRRKPLELDLPNSIEARNGQAVALGLSESLFLKLVFRLYGLPLIAGLMGAIAGYWFAGTIGASAGARDMATFLGAVVFVAGVLIFWNRTSRPDVSSSDVYLLDKTVTAKACGS